MVPPPPPAASFRVEESDGDFSHAPPLDRQSAAARIQASFRDFVERQRQRRLRRQRRRSSPTNSPLISPRFAAQGQCGAPAGTHDPFTDPLAPLSAREPRSLAVIWAKCTALAVAWFALSTALALYNKQLMGRHRGGFPAPLLLTSAQFFFQWVLACVLMRLRPLFATRSALTLASSTHHAREKTVSGVSNMFSFSFSRAYWSQVAPIGAALGLDIGLSNWSLVYITVSFYTLTKTASILFVLAFAFILKLEHPSVSLAAVMATIAVGEALTVAGETQFNAGGFFICLLASLMSGVRWILSQRVMHAHAARNPPHGGGGGKEGDKGGGGDDDDDDATFAWAATVVRGRDATATAAETEEATSASASTSTRAHGGGVRRSADGEHSHGHGLEHPLGMLRAVMPVCCGTHAYATMLRILCIT